MSMKNRIVRAVIRYCWEKHPERVREALSDYEIHAHRNPRKKKKA